MQKTSIREIPPELLLIAPLLALSTSISLSISAGLVFTLLLVLIAATVSAARYFIGWQVRLPLLMLIIATWTSLFDMFLTAWFYELRQEFGMYLPLLVVNSLVFAVVEEYYLRWPLRTTLSHALRTGGMLLLLFAATGAVREILATGGLFRDLGYGTDFKVHLVHAGNAAGLSLAGKAPGAFICLGLVLAVWNYFKHGKRAGLSINQQRQVAGIEQ